MDNVFYKLLTFFSFQIPDQNQLKIAQKQENTNRTKNSMKKWLKVSN